MLPQGRAKDGDPREKKTSLTSDVQNGSLPPASANSTSSSATTPLDKARLAGCLLEVQSHVASGQSQRR